MLRALWKGAISFGLIHIPVNLYSGESPHRLDLDMLDKRDFSPIGFKRVNKTTGKEVKWEDIVKGYEYEDDRYVVLTPEDIKRANPEATQTIDIMAFIDASEISPIYFEQPYYLAPGKGGDKVYALLRETLRKSGKVAIAQVVIRVKQHLAALMPIGDMIVLNLLRYADEIRPMDEYNLPKIGSKKTTVSDKEMQMAMSLVEGMTEDWKPDAFKDTYRDDLLAMIKKRIKANQTQVVNDEDIPPPETTSNVVDIMALLKKSIETRTQKAGVKPAKLKAESTKTESKSKTAENSKPKPITTSKSKPKTKAKASEGTKSRKAA
jgi:DNA end-binding protein Ku